jgi:hypothetical protein
VLTIISKKSVISFASRFFGEFIFALLAYSCHMALFYDAKPNGLAALINKANAAKKSLGFESREAGIGAGRNPLRKLYQILLL